MEREFEDSHTSSKVAYAVIAVGAGFVLVFVLGLVVLACFMAFIGGVNRAKAMEAHHIQVNVEPEKVTRSNFAKIGQQLSKAKSVLGECRQDSSFQNFATVSWQSADRRCTIRATYQMMDDGEGFIKSASIFGDGIIPLTFPVYIRIINGVQTRCFFYRGYIREISH